MPSRSSAPLSLVPVRSRTQLSDSELGRGLVAGEDWAITEAWRRFGPMVLTTGERVLGSRTEADDLAQDVFYRLFRTVKTLREPSSLRSYIYSIAIRALKSRLRYQRLRAWLSFQEPEALVDLRHTTLDVESRDALRKFHVLLNRLSARDKLVFMLRRVDGMTIEEIAAAMSLSPSTVKRSMNHASTRLSQWIAADPNLAGLADDNLMARWQ